MMAASVVFLILLLPKAIAVTVRHIYDDMNPEVSQDWVPDSLQIMDIVVGWPQHLNHSINLFIYMLTIKKFKVCSCFKPARAVIVGSPATDRKPPHHIQQNDALVTDSSNVTSASKLSAECHSDEHSSVSECQGEHSSSAALPTGDYLAVPSSSPKFY